MPFGAVAPRSMRIDQVVLPFIERTINFAMKEQKDGFGNQYRVGPPTKKVPPKGE
jgi:hypothetical protein